MEDLQVALKEFYFIVSQILLNLKDEIRTPTVHQSSSAIIFTNIQSKNIHLTFMKSAHKTFLPLCHSKYRSDHTRQSGIIADK